MLSRRHTVQLSFETRKSVWDQKCNLSTHTKNRPHWHFSDVEPNQHQPRLSACVTSAVSDFFHLFFGKMFLYAKMTAIIMIPIKPNVSVDCNNMLVSSYSQIDSRACVYCPFSWKKKPKELFKIIWIVWLQHAFRSLGCSWLNARDRLPFFIPIAKETAVLALKCVFFCRIQRALDSHKPNEWMSWEKEMKKNNLHT